MRLLATASILMAMAGACGGAGSSGEDELLVGAASSMEPLFSELGPAFERESGASLTFVYGSSGSLTVQIEQGAPLDVFASADSHYVNRLMGQGLVLNNRGRVVAEGRLAVLTTIELDSGATWRDAVTDDRVRYIAIANPEVAPYGLAARAALNDPDLWEVVQPRLVYGENVAQVLQFVQSGNADVGVVALSLVAPSPPEGVTVLPLDPCDHGLILHAVAAVRNPKTAAYPELAEEFMAFMGSATAKALLEQFGYDPPVHGGGRGGHRGEPRRCE